MIVTKSITFFSRLVVAAVTEASKQDASSSNTTTNAVALWIIRGAAAADATFVLSQLLSRRTSRDTARPTISRSAAQFDHHLVAALVITSSYTSRPGLAVCFLGTSVVDLPHNLRILPSHFQLAPSLASFRFTSLKAAGEICHSWACQGSPILATVIQTHARHFKAHDLQSQQQQQQLINRPRTRN